MTKTDHHLRAIFYALSGFSLWVASDTFLKLTGAMPVPKYEIMAISSIGGMSVILAFSAVRGGIGRLKPRKAGGLILLGCLHVLNFSMWLSALPRLPLANAYSVAFLSPVVVSILAAIFLREHFGWKHGLAIMAGFCGVTIAVNPEHLMHDPRAWLAYGLVFASMITMSFQMLLLRILGPKENRECAAFYPRIVILLAGLVAGLAMGFTPISFKGTLFALISGGVGSLGWLLMAHAYKMAPAALVAPFQYSEIITGIVVGYLIWHDIPTMRVLIGAAVIIASGIYIITHSRRSAALLKEETHS